jgi:transcriptional regulator with XRE-family HTH domain
MNEKKEFRRIKALMVEKGLTQGDLAKLAEMRVATLNLKLNGHNDFTISEMFKICNVLNIADSMIVHYFFN